MMMGTAGELPKAPPKPVQFLEDMTDAEVMTAVKFILTLENTNINFFDILLFFSNSWIFPLD